jgi:hypothetical protein
MITGKQLRRAQKIDRHAKLAGRRGGKSFSLNGSNMKYPKDYIDIEKDEVFLKKQKNLEEMKRFVEEKDEEIRIPVEQDEPEYYEAEYVDEFDSYDFTRLAELANIWQEHKKQPVQMPESEPEYPDGWYECVVVERMIKPVRYRVRLEDESEFVINFSVEMFRLFNYNHIAEPGTKGKIYLKNLGNGLISAQLHE